MYTARCVCVCVRVRRPVEDLPRIMRGALLVVTASYLLMNVAYLCVLTPEQIMHSDAIAVNFAQVPSPSP